MFQKVIIKKLNILRFKGMKDFEVNFDPKVTTIYGANGTGKTTLADAFMWLFFNKDTEDRANFHIKTIENGEVVPKLDYSVSAEVHVIKGKKIKEITLEKTYREKWQRPRGSSEEEMRGHETTYQINGMAVTQAEYNNTIEAIAGNEDIFKLVTSPLHFPTLHWEKQRGILFDAMGLNDGKLLNSKKYQAVKEECEKKSTEPEQLLKHLKSVVNKTAKEINNLNTRIDEASLGISKKVKPGMLENAEEEISKLTKQMEEQVDKLSSLSKQETPTDKRIRDIKKEIFIISQEQKEQRDQVVDHYSKNIMAIDDVKRKDNSRWMAANDRIEQMETTINRITDYIKEADTQLNIKRAEYKQVKQAEFDVKTHDDVVSCSHCGRPYEGDDYDEQLTKAINSFNNSKASSLDRIKKEAEKIKTDTDQRLSRKAKYEKELQDTQEEYQELEGKIKKATDRIAELDKEYKEKLKKFETMPKKYNDLRAELKDITEKSWDDESQATKENIQRRITVLEKKLETERNTVSECKKSADAQKRVSEIRKELTKTKETQAENERMIDLIQSYIHDMVREVESAIKEKFTRVDFQMFKFQVNGELVPTCEVMTKDGIPFATMNQAMRVSVGIEIINVLQEKYKLYAPIWIDNKESFTKLPETPAQVINLKVSESHPQLHVDRMSDVAYTLDEEFLDDELLDL